MDAAVNRSGPLRIALAYPGTAPETFIQAHLDHLRDVVLYLWDGFPPRREGRERTILHASGKGRLKNAMFAALQGRDLGAYHADRIAKLLSQHKVDVVLAEFGYEAAEMIGPCEKAGVPLVAHFHGIDAHGHGYLGTYDHYARLFRSAAAIIAVSRHMEEQLLVLGAPREKLFHICYGVDMDRFHARDIPIDGPHFLSVGRFVEKKAPQLTILAFAKVLSRTPQAKLTMVGNGRLWEACVQMVKAMGLSHSIALPGPEPAAVVADRMRNSHGFIQHSIAAMDGDSEGTPVAILEALASGIPVVATRHAGIVDVVEHGKNGLLCEPLDIEGMAANISRLVEEPGLANDMGMTARARALKEFPMDKQISMLQEVLHFAVDGARRRSPRP